MKGRETKASPPKADLLVCFPSRAHLTLMPKPICSPGRPPEPNKRHHNNHHHNHYHLKKSSTTRSCGQSSPLLWAKTKSIGSEIAEPTSPKVTCAGQIKVGPKTTACRSWQSVIEKIEKIHTHNGKKEKRIPNWPHCLSFKKEAMQLLACFRGMRFDLRCFGTFAEANIGTEEEEQDEYEDEEGYRGNQVVIEESENETSTVFSKWFMVLQENQSNVAHKEGKKDKDNMEAINDGSNEAEERNVPPPNALLLMRCRSAPVRSLFGEKEEEKNEEKGKEANEHREEGKVKKKAAANNNKGKSLESLMEENRKKEKSMLAMRYDSDFHNISSSGIAQETWIVGGLRDPFSRSGGWNK